MRDKRNNPTKSDRHTYENNDRRRDAEMKGSVRHINSREVGSEGYSNGGRQRRSLVFSREEGEKGEAAFVLLSFGIKPERKDEKIEQNDERKAEKTSRAMRPNEKTKQKTPENVREKCYERETTTYRQDE